MTARDREPLQPHSVREWVDGAKALGSTLKKVGGEWKGPCPVCGGTDRFHVKPGRKAVALVQCRHGCPFIVLAAAVFGKGNGTGLPPRGPEPGRIVTTPQVRAVPVDPEPAKVWRRSDDAEGTPAARYLRARFAWPPEGGSGAAYFPAITDAVRWLPASIVPLELPANSTGCVGYRFTRRVTSASPASVVTAVQVEALTAEGDPVDPRWRRCIGNKAGSVFAVPPIVGDGTWGVRIVEGEITALAAALLNPTKAVRGTGGTAGFTVAALDGLSATVPVVLEGDGDPAGRKAEDDLERALRASGRKVEVQARSGEDAAEDLEHLVAEAWGMTGDLAAGWRRVLDWLPRESE